VYKKIIWIGLSVALIAGCGAPLKTARQQFESGAYEQSIRESRAVLAKDSTATDAYILLMKSYLKLGNLDSAETVLRIAEKTIEKTDAIHQLGFEIKQRQARQKKEQEHYQPALVFFKQALSYNPRDPETLEEIGDVYYELGYHDRALEWYTRLDSISQDSIEVAGKIDEIRAAAKTAQSRYETGLNDLEQGRIGQAVETLGQALEVKPDHGPSKYYYHLAKGQQLYNNVRGTDLWEAIEAFGNASAVRPDAAEPHYWLGMAYNKMNKKDYEYDNAISEFERVIELEPTGPVAEKAKEKLKELKKRRKLMKEFWGK
jgi:tetratricopeptide (TPR) repeat protein